jgi:hypothetical protein
MFDRNAAIRCQEKTITTSLSNQHSRARARHARETSIAIEPRFVAPHVAVVEVQHRLCLETAKDP